MNYKECQSSRDAWPILNKYLDIYVIFFFGGGCYFTKLSVSSLQTVEW
jgi:hypothetical protein